MNGDTHGIELVPRLQAAAAGELLAKQSPVVALVPLAGAAFDNLDLRRVLLQQALGHAAKSDDIQTGPAVVDDDLDRYHFAHSRDLADLLRVMLRQLAGRGTEAVLPIYYKRSIGSGDLRRLRKRLLKSLNRGEQKHPGANA